MVNDGHSAVSSSTAATIAAASPGEANSKARAVKATGSPVSALTQAVAIGADGATRQRSPE
jgi:hypothetical protein